MKASALSLLMLAALPAVLAASTGQATLAVEDGIAVRAQEGGGTLAAAYTDAPAGVVLTCPEATVHREEIRSLQVGNAEFITARESARYVLHDVRAEFLPGGGWLGIYGSSATSFAAPDAQLRAVLSSTIGNAPATPEPAPDYERASFSVQVSAPHFAVEANETAIHTVSAAKFSDATVHIQAAENESTLDTTAPAGPERVRRWAVLECAEAGVMMGFRGDVLVRDWRAPIAERVEIGRATGAATLDGHRVSLQDEPLTLVGEFALSATPVRGELGVVVDIDADGEFSTASTVPLPAPAVRVRWLPTGLALLVGLAAGGAAVFAYRRRTEAPRPTLEECTDLANQAAQEGRFQLALEWIERALAHAPDHPRLLLDRAFFLSEVGRNDEALDAYRAAAAGSASGEAEVLLARTLCTFGEHPAEAADAVGAALAKDPMLLLEVEEDAALAWCLREPRNADRVRDAREAIGEE